MQVKLLAASVVFASAAQAAGQYGQCGGIGWSGDPTCPSGWTCVKNGDYYSQCLPGGPAVTTTTTQAPPPTTTTTRTTTTPGACPTLSCPPPVTVTVTSTVGVVTTTKTTTTTVGTTTTTTRVPTTTTTTAGPTPTGDAIGPYPVTGGAATAGNPYAGMPRFVSPDYAAKVDTSIAKSTDATFKAAAAKVRKIPTYNWLDTISAIDNLPKLLAEAAAQSGGKDIVAEFVIYDLPGRDCHALASNGEIVKGDITRYKTQYIDPIVEIFKTKAPNVRTILVIEPDSLPNLATNMGSLNCDAQTALDYHQGVAYAVARLSEISNNYMYLDIGHGGWLGWPDNAAKSVPIFQKVITDSKAINPAATFRGFATNTAGYSAWSAPGVCPALEKCPLLNGMYDYNPATDEQKYTQVLTAAYANTGLPTRWIVDTSRNGKAGIRKVWGSWCNIKGAGLGNRPASDPASGIDAFAWVKPPGDSDGVSGPAGTPRLDGFCDPTTVNGQDSLSGAPQAGQWFHDQFVMLVNNAVPVF